MAVLIFLSSLVLSGCGSGPGHTVTPVQPILPATVTMNVTPSSVMPGQSATLTWTSSNASSCTASGAWSGSMATSGSATVQLQGSKAQVYTLSCVGSGLPRENSVSLNVAQEQGACAASNAARAHGKRIAHGRKLAGARS